MVELARTGNSSLPARLLPTPNQSLVFVVFFVSTEAKAKSKQGDLGDVERWATRQERKSPG